MDKVVEQKLEEANKLIFVKRYHEAERILDDVTQSAAGRGELLVHLRRIELAAMLKKLDKLRTTYQRQLASAQDTLVAEVCIALAEQHGEFVPPTESVATFQELMKEHGPLAVAFYGIGYGMEQQGNYERAEYNYEQALTLDPGWIVAYFGLSQIHYQMSDEKRGDHFFYLFEQAAPYNVYGNFETHRRLCQEFMEKDRFAEAEAAIQSLSEWWLDNKGTCPTEIQVYELLATARISEAQGDKAQADSRRARASVLASHALEDPRTSEGVLYFIAKILEEFGDFTKSFQYYKRILQSDSATPAMIQKIGSQFLSLGEYRLAKELFDDAYSRHPEHPDIRFCLLVSNLKLASVNVEEYLIGRERLRQLVETGGDKVELLSLLHSLMAKFGGDADVQGQIADVYLRLGNVDRAARHYDAMYEIDGKNRHTALKFAAFMMQYRSPDTAMEILGRIQGSEALASEAQAEIYWLKANFHARRQQHQESQQLLRRVLALDPWSVSYLVQEIINLINLANIDEESRKVDQVLVELSGSDDVRVSWVEFDQATARFEAQHAYELVYARSKLRYLYANGSEDSLLSLVRAACKHDANRATYDFIKLLNTNFDSANIYWALGIICKELWQLETATAWFEQMLLYPNLTKSAKAKAYLELADCFIWQNRQLPKAIEYAKIAVDLDEKKDLSYMRVLAHAYLKSGQVRQAKLHLDEAEASTDHETRYLAGLMHYRNGAQVKANEIWKPLLTVRSESLRFHNIKQEVLKFYFEGAPYLKAN